MIQQPQIYSPYGQYATPPHASAVNIQIFEPKAFGGTQAPVANVAPVQQPVYDKGLYAYPQAPIYEPVQSQYVNYPPFYHPMTFAPPSSYYDQLVYTPNAQQTAIQQNPIQPAVMPQPVLQQPQVQNTPLNPQVQPDLTQEQNVNVVPAPVQKPAVDPVSKVEIEQPQEQPIQKVDVQALIGELNSADLAKQTDAITKIAQLSQSSTDIAPQVVDEQIMQGLLGIIKKDTAQLEGPSKQQIAIAQKIKNGEQLTPSEQAIAEQSSPRETAEKNKVFAMFTLAMLQKLLRDEVDTYNSGAQAADKQIPPLDITPFVTEISGAIEKSDIPAVKTAGIQALSHVAYKPEDKTLLENAIGKFVYDPDLNISQAAKEVLQKVGTV